MTLHSDDKQQQGKYSNRASSRLGKSYLVMTRNGANKKQTKGQRREELERKRDDRVRRNALKKERKAKEYLEEDQNFSSFSNQLEVLGLKIKDIPGDG